MSVVASLCCRRGSGDGQHLDLTVVDLSPSQLAMNAMVGVERQPPRESVDLDVRCATVEGGGEAIGIEAEREVTVSTRAATVGVGGLQSVSYCVREIAAQHPGHVGKDQAFEVLVVVRIGFERIGSCVGRYAAGEVESQLGAQQAFDVCLRRGEDELDVATPARLELQLGAEDGFQPAVPGAAVANA